MATVSINPVRPRRFLELVLMLLALAVGIGGYVITSINRTGELPANLGLHIGILLAIAILAEIGVHFLAPYADPVILPVAVALTGMGLAMIYRIDLSLNALGMDTVGMRQLRWPQSFWLLFVTTESCVATPTLLACFRSFCSFFR